MFEALKLKFKLARMRKNQIEDSMEKMISENEKAEAPVKALIGLFIVAVLAGALVPISLTSLHSANQTGWSVSEVATYGIIAIFVLISVIVLLAKIATD